jgi:hypothetical protein
MRGLEETELIVAVTEEGSGFSTNDFLVQAVLCGERSENVGEVFGHRTVAAMANMPFRVVQLPVSRVLDGMNDFLSPGG